MKAVIETATGKALYLFGDGETVTVTDTGMTSPVTALDIRSAMHSVVTTTAPSFFTGGGVMRWDDAWEILDQEAYDAAYDAANPPATVIETPPKLLACALRIPIVDGEVQTIGGAYRIPALMLMDAGTFLAVFTENLGEAEPFIIPNNGIHVSVSEWGGDYAMIEVRDHAGGSLITPASFGFSLYSF